MGYFTSYTCIPVQEIVPVEVFSMLMTSVALFFCQNTVPVGTVVLFCRYGTMCCTSGTKRRTNLEVVQFLTLIPVLVSMWYNTLHKHYTLLLYSYIYSTCMRVLHKVTSTAVRIRLIYSYFRMDNSAITTEYLATATVQSFTLARKLNKKLVSAI